MPNTATHTCGRKRVGHKHWVSSQRQEPAVASYPQYFSGAKSSSPPKGKITKAKLPANHSNTLSILSNLTIALSAKGRAENGFVGLMTRRGRNPQNCGKDMHSRCGHLVPLTRRTVKTAKTTCEVRVDALIITFVRAVSRKNEKN
jgi:hypothetical protein